MGDWGLDIQFQHGNDCTPKIMAWVNVPFSLFKPRPGFRFGL